MDVRLFNQINGQNVPLKNLKLTTEHKDEYKQVKRLFCDFVRTYNTGQISIDEEAKNHLHQLHKMWKEASLKQNLNYFFSMKDHHVYLNHLDCSIWKDHTDGFMKWRLVMMAQCDSV